MAGRPQAARSGRRFIASLAVAALVAVAAVPPPGLAATALAADDPPPSPCVLQGAPADPAHGTGVAAIGILEAVHADGKNLQVVQDGLEFTKPDGHPDSGVDHHLSVGYPGNHLQVNLDDESVVCVGGVVSTMDALVPLEGQSVIVGGTITGASVKATFVSDLSVPAGEGSMAAAAAAAGMRPTTVAASGVPPDASAAGSSTLSVAAEIAMCLGQDMDYGTKPYLKEFQGCFGGPSGSDSTGTWIPIICTIVGCLVIDRLSYTAAIAGWAFDFPFEFGASGSTPAYGRDTLTYHVPGTVTLGVSGKPATDGEFTFSGGIGLNIGIRAEFCAWWDCYGVGSFNLNAYSMIHQATEAPPLIGQTMEIKEVACPNIDEIGIPGVDIPFLKIAALKLCQDLTLTGQKFQTLVTATATSTIGSDTYGFGPETKTMDVTPDGIPVAVTYDQLDYAPLVDMGLRFRLTFGSGVYTWDIPGGIPLGTASFHAVCPGFPSCGTWMSHASDPNGAAGNTIEQPTSVGFSLSVAPAPTQLHIVSSATIAEGQPVQAKLVEDYSKAPVVGETVTFTATSEAGPLTMTGTTDAAGVARAVFPIGEYRPVKAAFAGTSYFEPSSDRMSPVYVYRPTNFVIWGGNAGGFPVGGDVTFWSSQWSKQVTGGDYAGGSSFKGWAESISVADGTWTSPPATATPRAPAAVPLYIGVVVTTRVTSKGSRAVGNVADLVVLRVDDPAAYGLGPGHAGTGILKAPIR
jgi:hypothetical protein